MTNPNFKFGFTTPTNPNATDKPDTRDWVESMFFDHEPTTGNHQALQIKAQDASKLSRLGDIKTETNCIPLLLRFGAAVDEYNGKLKGEDVLVLGGARSGKAGQGKLYIPLSQVEGFVDNIKALTEAVEAELPKLLVATGLVQVPDTSEEE